MLENLDCSAFIKYETKKENGKISDLQITDVDLPALVEQLYEKVDPRNNLNDTRIHFQFSILGQEQKLLLASQMLITRYCLHRVLTHYKVYESDNWSYQIGEDYYGEEIQGVSLKPEIASKIEHFLEDLRTKNVTEKIEMVLKLEYGRLIPSVVNKKWYVCQVQPHELYYSNQEHYLQCQSDLKTDEFEQYREILRSYPYPRALTILNPNGQYKVIDGYHRLVGCPTDQNPLVIYCLRDE